jgi:hypothetical protein
MRMTAPSGTVAIELIRLWVEASGLDLHENLLEGSGAVFSPCGTYRYLLWRHAYTSTSLLGFGMLNPSTADHRDDDPTIRRCMRWALDTRPIPSGLLVWNLFALRATDPAELIRHPDPVGPKNDDAIQLALGFTDRTIAAWGTNGTLGSRDRAVLRRCAAQGSKLHALKLTKEGHPGHPLYLPKSAAPVEWDYDW